MNTLEQSIDLLVDGELDEAGRRALLEQLESHPHEWKQCALAFLEAQAWKSAVKVVEVPMIVAAKPRRKRTAVAWLARAACVLIVFAIGWAMGRNPRESRPVEVVRPSPKVESIARPAMANKRPDRPPVAPKPPGYLQAKLEREGFKVEQRLVIVPARTSTGRRVGVPVEQTKVRFVGNRTI